MVTVTNLNEALKEIDRLRAENAQMAETIGNGMLELVQIRADVRKLREALREYSFGKGSWVACNALVATSKWEEK